MPALAFDVDDTLYDLAEPYRRAVGEYFGDLPGVSLDELFIRSRIRSDEAYELVLAGKRPVEHMHVYRVQKAFGDVAGIDVPRKDALAFQRVYEKHQGMIGISDQMRRLLAACADAGWVLGIISNGDAAHQWAKVDALGICGIVPRDHVVISGEVGFCKPAVEIFRTAESKLGIGADECWFVGDTYDCDVVGALDAGWRCIWFNRRMRALQAGERRPTCEAHTEDELVQAVEGLICC